MCRVDMIFFIMQILHFLTLEEDWTEMWERVFRPKAILVKSQKIKFSFFFLKRWVPRYCQSGLRGSSHQSTQLHSQQHARNETNIFSPSGQNTVNSLIVRKILQKKYRIFSFLIKRLTSFKNLTLKSILIKFHQLPLALNKIIIVDTTPHHKRKVLIQL